MSEPLAVTFKLLSMSENSHATDALLKALDIPNELIRAYATEALILRRNLGGQLELIRRLSSLNQTIREILARHRGTLDYAIRQSLLQGDNVLKEHALIIVSWIDDFQQIPALLEMLNQIDLPQREQVIELLRNLTDQFYTYLQEGPRHGGPHLRDPGQFRNLLLEKLERSTLEFSVHQCEAVVESLLILAPIEHHALKSLLRPIQDPARQAADKILRESAHPGILHKFTEFLSREGAPLKILQVIKQREDVGFLAHLLSSLPRRLTSSWQGNIKKLDDFSWLRGDLGFLKELAPALQERFVTFLGETGLPESERHRIYTWIMQNGAPGARSATTRLLANVNQTLVQELVLDGIDSEEESVQAWATSQLRVCGIPQAFHLLVSRLDSPLPQVQQAARKELEGFDLKRFLEVFENTDPGACVRAGILLRKIDPQISEKICEELTHPMRTRKLRALKAVISMQLAREVIPTLKQMLRDDEIIIRRMAIATLKTVPTMEVFTEFQTVLTSEQNPRVREDLESASLAIGLKIRETLQPATAAIS
ncbi:MAG: hypothetical protein U0903_02165 [Planctomycetales bacterium]